jgi:hypothetical protein
MTLIFTVIGLLLVGFGILRRFLNVASDRKVPGASQTLTSGSTDPTELKDKVEQLLTTDSPFEVREISEKGPEFEHLGQQTKEFFERYPHVRSRSGSTVLGKDLVSLSTYASGYISIGHTEDWDIVTKRGEDRIFVLEGAESSPEETDDQYATIYHFIYDEAMSTKSKA